MINMKKFIYAIVFFISMNLYSIEFNKNDSCLYFFQASEVYDAELKIEVKELLEKDIKLLVTQRNGAITTKKEVLLNKDFNIENALDSFIRIMKAGSKKEIKLKSSKITDDYKFVYRAKKYTGYLIKASIEIDKKLYRVSYIFSEELPLLGLFRFTITQDVKSKRNYRFKNIMLIKECKINGKLIKL